MHRAAHQVLEQGRIFNDPLALPILGEDVETVVKRAQESPFGQRLRIFIAVRTRFAEDALASAVERGTRQLVVLGAGLDTYAYRGAMRDRLRIFEVDHPASQAWKQQRLAEAGIAVPPSVTFAPIDFERQTLADGLATAGFDPEQPTFFTWLGMVPYLSETSVWSTLQFIAGLPNGAHVVFDYSDPPYDLPGDLRAGHATRAAHVAELGEAWITYFSAAELRPKLLDLGFQDVEDLAAPQMASLYFPGRAAGLPEKGGHVVRASTLAVQ